MSWGDWIIRAIEGQREGKRMRSIGPLGDFYRAGGSELLYTDLPVDCESLVIDVGGYRGEWTADMLIRYGCRSLIFEPVPAFAAHCRDMFVRNQRVRVEEAALGGVPRLASFCLAANGSSEFIPSSVHSDTFTAEVRDVVEVLTGVGEPLIACLKLNIEGGEYEVLERLLVSGAISQCRALLIQFHRQPDDWKPRYDRIVDGLKETHVREWGYSMVWEKWRLWERL